MRALLTVETGQAEPMVYELPADAITTMGRNRKNAIVLHDEHASRKHAEILRVNGQWVLRDLETLNGTKVNGRIVREHVLERNHLVIIGRTRMRFTVEDTDVHAVQTDPTAEMPKALPTDERSEMCRTILATDELTTLCDFMAVAVSETDPRALIRKALEMVLVQTRAETTGFLSLDEDDPLPKLVLPERAHVDTHLSRRLTHEVQQTGRTVWLGAGKARPAESESLCSFRDALCVPLRDGDAYLGALHNYSSHRQFAERDVQFCEVLAWHLANSLRLLRNRRTLEAENSRLRARAPMADKLIGRSPVMQKMRQMIQRAAAQPSTVLIIGESGSGKELVAQALHQQSTRRRGPFVTHNCAVATATLLESDLFGHVKGAFTGADADRPGLFQLADDGTLFLDEIGEMPQDCQAKLLRVIEGRGFRPVGGTTEIRTDVRILAATNRDLEEEVKQRRFRTDLLFRLRVIPIHVPSLRKRLEDIPELVSYFLEKLAPQCRRQVSIAPAALKRLQEYDWPGNVRQLRTALENALVMSDHDVLQPDDFGVGASAAPSHLPTLNLDELEALAVKEALLQTGWNVTQAAKLLHIARDTLINKIKKLGIAREQI